MNLLNRSLFIITAAVALPISANASLLVGFHNFDSLNSVENQDVSNVNGFFSGQISESNASNASGGSNDGTYGSVLGGAPSGDGYLVSTNSASPITMKVDYSVGAGVPQSLSYLLFDAVGPSTNGVNVSYNYDNLGWSTPMNFAVASLSPAGPGAAQNYSDLLLDLSSITMAPGKSIEFRFATGGGAMRLDNIALVAIPETASMLALCGLMTGGLFMRKRREVATPSVA